MSDIVLSVKNLTKNYGSFCAVDHISFEVPKGKVVGFLGPNGAGKTTTIQMLLGITKANGGEISYFGDDFFSHRQKCLQRINFASAQNTLQGRITVWENLLVFAKLYGIAAPQKKIQELLEYFGAAHLARQRFWDLSAGERTRVVLVKSLLNDPELILMDEPTSSLDPDIADKTLSLIESLRASRRLSILYTSHDMDEVTRVCDSVIFLDHGKIVAEDTPLGLTKRITRARLKLTFDGTQETVKKYLQSKDMQGTYPTPSVVVVEMEERAIPKIIFGVSNAGIWITDIEVKKPTLEDVFLEIARGKHDIR